MEKADDVEYVATLEAENAFLRERVEEYERNIIPLLGITQQLPKIAALQEEVGRLRYDLAAMRPERLDLEELPSDLLGVMKLIASFYGARVVFAPEAGRSAVAATFQDAHVAWRVLRAMATTLLDLYVGGEKDIEREFRNRTGFEVALTESSETWKDRRLRRRRVLDIGGKQLDISAHVKFGVRPPRLLRVHYAFDSGAIIVGHCGDHLPTAGTRRMS